MCTYYFLQCLEKTVFKIIILKKLSSIILKTVNFLIIYPMAKNLD